MVKFSVIVPVYNISSYIDQSVESIVNQTYRNLEIILVNDGSKDDSLAKLREWEKKDNRIVVIDKPNGGLSDARNAGLKIATGDYIGFVDGDDWLATDLYEKVVSEIESYPSIDVITFSIKKVYPSGKEILLSYNMPCKPIKGSEYFKESNFYVNAWSKIYRREYIKDRCFIKGLLHEDIPYTIPAVNDAALVGNIGDSYYYYRQEREGSILNTYSEKKLKDWLVGMSILFRYAENKKDTYLNQWILDRVIGATSKALNFSDYWKYYNESKIQESVTEIYKTVYGRNVKFWLCNYFAKPYLYVYYTYRSLKAKLRK